ncbi:acyl-CoA thioesterase [Frigoribacterium sp. 2-23]|uniref:acyl-CoA thioesterase n=1 Tax=Frigoribacterium sp. 2-23 TaxID=3415006 RepID=UPI003C6FE419
MTRLHVPTRLRWSDLDAYGHVNNAAMLRLLEEARIDAFWSRDDPSAEAMATAVLDGRTDSQTMTLIARQELEYLLPIPYLRSPLDIQLWIGRLGGASLEVCYEVWSPVGVAPAQLFTRASTTIVLVDADTDRPRRISDVERAAWTPFVEEPLTFRRH